MTAITGIKRGLSKLTSYILPPALLLLVFMVLTTSTAVQKNWLAEIVIPAAEAASQATVPLPVTSLATSTALPNIVAASFQTSLVPLYSQDGGLSWYPVHTTPWADDPSALWKVAVAPRGDPNAPVRILAAVSSSDSAKMGVYRTGDYGQSWAFIHIGHASPSCNSYFSFPEFVVSPADPNRLYLSNYCAEDIFGGSRSFGNLFTSPDAGVTWQLIDSDIGGPIIPSPTIPGRVYLIGQKSDDGGLHWTPTNFPVGTLALDAQDPARLYGLAGSIGRRSINEGQTWVDWIEQPCPVSHGNEQLLAHPTLSQVLLLRCDSSLFRSNDGGDHWVELSPWQGQQLVADYGNPGKIFWIRNDGLWATQSQGASWSHLTVDYAGLITPWQNVSTPDPVGAIYALTALSPTNIWAVGENGLILHWQGQEWLPVDSPVTASLFSIAFVSANNGWAVGDQTILHWDGNTWSPVSHPASGILKSVDIVTANNIWAVGSDGVILHWNGQNWQGVSSPTTLPLESVDMVSPTDGWAVGGLEVLPDLIYSGIILRWNGVNWTPFTTTSFIVRSVDMLSASEGWSVGNMYAGGISILRWNGTSWQEVPHPDGWELASVSMVSANEGWAVGWETALYWDGQSWASDPISTELNPSSVVALFANEVWIASYEEGRVVRSQTIRDLYLPNIRKE